MLALGEKFMFYSTSLFLIIIIIAMIVYHGIFYILPYIRDTLYFSKLLDKKVQLSTFLFIWYINNTYVVKKKGMRNMEMDGKRPYCPILDVDGVISGGKQFDLDITLPDVYRIKYQLYNIKEALSDFLC